MYYIHRSIYFNDINSSSAFLFHMIWALGSTCKNNFIKWFWDTGERQCGQVCALKKKNDIQK